MPLESDGRVTLEWTASLGAERYDLDLYPTIEGSTGPNATRQEIYVTSYSFYPVAGVSEYTFRVRPINSTCSIQYGSWTTPATFNITSEVSGNFYSDPSGLASLQGDYCELVGAGTGTVGTGSSISALTPDFFAGVISSGLDSYTIELPSGGLNNTISLIPGEESPGVEYECTCPAGCEYGGVPSNQANVNFFFRPTNLADGWWQVAGGSSYAERSSGTAISSQISTTYCTEANSCTPAIITRNQSSVADSAGIAVTGGGEIDSSSEAGFQSSYISDRTDGTTAAKGTVASKFRENYDFFYRLYSMGTNPTSDFTGSEGDALKPSGILPEGKRAYYSANGLTIQTPWNVAAGESIVVFIEGNLTLNDLSNAVANDRMITVAEGGFLAFIVNGDIIIGETVGNDTLTDTTPNAEGMFVAQNQLIIESRGSANGGDSRFVGAGTFVGWGGVDLQRDFRSDADAARAIQNSTKPAELFVFRPDFVTNLPARMTTPRYVWQETN
ncbi:MAG: hypothetical protein M3Q81_01750 [bacterium]|nr:hypothetical protein [bacterium]